MKNQVLSIVFACLACLQAFGQKPGSIIGTVKEAGTDSPLGFATVTLYKMQSGQMVTGCVTDSVGHFCLQDITAGNYYLEGSFVGCSNVKSAAFSVADGKTTNVGTLFIKEEGKQLGELVVEGKKSTLQTKIDRKVFNVGQDLMSNSGTASDIMQNIPSVDVDMDGNVSLRGNDNVTILINGKPSAMMSAKSRGDALNQLSATDIDKIEVITNPSAEYKPDGVSGIINIIMKRDAKRGINGTVNGNVGSAGRTNASVNLNYGTKRLNLFGGYTFRRDRYDRTTDDHRISPNDTINQTTYGLGRPISHTFRLGMNSNLTSHDYIEIAGNYSRRRFSRNEQVESETKNLAGMTTYAYERTRDALAKENMWEGSLQYNHTYGKNSEWGIGYNYSSESEDEMNHYTNIIMGTEAKDNEWVWDANYLHIGKLHWLHNVNDNIKLSSGYEIEHLRAEQSYHVFDWDGNKFVPNKERTSDFAHLRLTHSLYTTTEIRCNPFSFLIGLRGEYVDIKNKLLSQSDVFGQYYANFFPTLHSSWHMNEKNELQLNYSLRVNRPEGSDLNPFAERINPLSLESGNPNLKPEKIHSLELGWMWNNQKGTSFLSTIYYRYLKNEITEVSRYIEDEVLLTTKENLNSSHSAGMEIVLSCSTLRWLSFNWNLNGFYNQIDASKLGFSKKKDAFSWSTLLNANITPVKHYMIQLNARLRGASLVPQGKRDADCRINLGMKYDVPKYNLSILASVTDLFDTYRKSYSLDTPELKQKVEKRRNPRIFYIGFSWQFGGGKSKRHQPDVEYDEGL